MDDDDDNQVGRENALGQEPGVQQMTDRHDAGLRAWFCSVWMLGM